ncbi:hypothetical protein ACODT3_21045 [Streptomyces sp. 4.24]|uniref:hypothetical protein n=1 Tax=Streptomyces tritrimontium TaxID=3406573 RepID=UPI003BB7FAC8
MCTPLTQDVSRPLLRLPDEIEFPTKGAAGLTVRLHDHERGRWTLNRAMDFTRRTPRPAADTASASASASAFASAPASVNAVGE